MTAHQYGTGPFDAWPKSVTIRRDDKPNDLLRARNKLMAAQNNFRAIVGRDLRSIYSDGYDRGLTYAISIIDTLIDGEQS
ncbi:hypothetical protein ACFYY5_29260 [Nocardia elegans]|uniref:Uncharacterized protein n=1 Tax=Nocardia elegans TaxID=300029 RepID=A0ABW6TLC9_9NOCA